MTIAIDEPEAWLEGLRLDKGLHDRPELGMCLLEAAAYLAGEEHSDHPQCVSPVLGAVGRILNDTLRPNDRQKLKAHLPQMLGTAGDGLDETRTALVFDWTLRTHAPRWLRYAGVSEVATLVQGLPQIHDLATLARIKDLLLDLYRKARDASRGQTYEASRQIEFDVPLSALDHAIDSAETIAQAQGAQYDPAPHLPDMAGDAIPTFSTTVRATHYDAVADTERDLVDLFARLIRPIVPPRIEG